MLYTTGPLYITHVHMGRGGTSVEHIEELMYQQPDGMGVGKVTVQDLVLWLQNGNRAYVAGPPKVEVVVDSRNGRYWVTTAPDATTTNNLLSLPHY
jgi:hypothetical protein